MSQFNYILIIGEQEQTSQTVEIRTREGQKMVTLKNKNYKLYIGKDENGGICLTLEFTIPSRDPVASENVQQEGVMDN